MRKWLECVADVPWLPSSTAGNGAEGPGSQHVLLRAISVMDERHYGLKPVKRRIVQYLAVQLLSQARSKGEGGARAPEAPWCCARGSPRGWQDLAGEDNRRELGQAAAKGKPWRGEG